MLKEKLNFFVIFIILQFFTANTLAVDPDEFLQDKKQEERARKISNNVRCLVCQNQNIDDSSSELAKDLRILIRKKIKEGDSDEDIYKFLTDRYGDFVLLKPPFKFSTLLLWILPFVFYLISYKHYPIFHLDLHNLVVNTYV